MKHKKIFCRYGRFTSTTGCGSRSSEHVEKNSSKKLSVVATNSIIADMIKEVGKDEVSVHSIVPVGTDPHEYEPLPEDIKNERSRCCFL